MPGHVKLGKAGEPDPDPIPYLVVSMEMKREDAHKPYDSKKSVWCPYEKDGGFIEGLLQEGTLDGGKCTVMIGHEVGSTWIKICQRVRSKFSCPNASRWCL